MAFDGFFLTTKQDVDARSRFEKIKSQLPNIKMLHIPKDTWEDNTMVSAVVEAVQEVNTRYFWVIDPDVLVDDEFDFSFEPDEWNKDVLHYWNCETRNDTNRVVGIKLYKTKDVFIGVDEYVNKSYYLDVPHLNHTTTLPSYSPTKEIYDVFRVNNIYDIEPYANQSYTTMFWMIDNAVSPYMKDIDTFEISPYDQGLIHNFSVKLPNGSVVINGIRLVPKRYDLTMQKDMYDVLGDVDNVEIVYARTPEDAIELANSYSFWMVNPDLELIEPSVIDEFYPNIHDPISAHVYKIQSKSGNDFGYGGIMFLNKKYSAGSISHLDRFAMTTPSVCRVPIYNSRDHHDVFVNKSKDDYLYWYVDSAISTLDEFKYDFYPDIYSMNNVFTFNGGGGGTGVYFVNRKFLSQFELTEEDFLYDRFQNLKHIDQVVSKSASHPVFYFDEGLYPENTKKIKSISDIQVIDSTDLEAAYVQAATLTTTGYFWAIDNDVELKDFNFPRSYYVDRANKSHYVVWPKENPYTGLVYQYGGVKLCPSEATLHLKPDADKIRRTNFANKIHVKTPTARSRDIPYDTIFLSYNEPFADENYEKLLKRVPNAKRVHGVKGIFNAHKKAAELAETKMFYVVDADAILLDEFEFEYFPNYWDEDTVHTWRSKNPVNGLVYGYGGLKLFPTKLLRNATDWKIDFTTSVTDKFKPMQVVANYTAFNTDPFNTWKSAFRECTKLAANIIQRGDSTVNNERLTTWCEVGADKPFGEYAIAGAKMGKAHGTKYSTNEVEISKINDFEWLKAKFEETYNDNSNKRTQSKKKLQNKKAR
jgi:hypothetical protein